MSIRLFLFDKLLRLRMKRAFEKNPDVMLLRPMMIELAKIPARMPKGVRIDLTEIGGVPVERLVPADADLDAAIVYIHGGGFVAGSPKNHRPITGRLAAGLGVPVYAPDYRLAPEHPFPAGLDDVVAVVRALFARGIAPARLAIAGDSAGGNLTFATALKLKAIGAPLPRALVALSPATDIPTHFPSVRSNARRDAVFDERMFGTLVAHYCPGTDPGDPFISPYRGDLAGLPPTLIQCSDAEMLRDDGVEMAERLKAAVVPTTLEVYPAAPHVWQLAADFVPESRRAIDAMVTFLRPFVADSRLVNAQRAALTLAALALVACTNTISMSGANAAIPQVRVHAESELDCPQANIAIEEQPGGRFLAVGCGKKAVYQAQCVGLTCRVRGPNDPPIPFRDFPDPGSPLLQP